MAAVIRPDFTLHLHGTSLVEGIYCTPDHPWPMRLLRDMRASPECRGPVRLVNLGKGSQQSSFGRKQALAYAAQRPSHVLVDLFHKNDCVALSDADGNPPAVVPLATSASNLTDLVNAYRTERADVVIAGMTMHPNAAADANRANEVDWVDNAKTTMAGLDVEVLDHWAAWTAAGKNPLPPELTVSVGGTPDQLHVLWANAFALYSYPAILAWARTAMGAYWP